MSNILHITNYESPQKEVKELEKGTQKLHLGDEDGSDYEGNNDAFTMEARFPHPKEEEFKYEKNVMNKIHLKKNIENMGK